MNLINASAGPFSRSSTMPQATSSTPASAPSPDKGAHDCVKRYPVDQFSLRNLQRGYA